MGRHSKRENNLFEVVSVCEKVIVLKIKSHNICDAQNQRTYFS